jgi:hypothetical protein
MSMKTLLTVLILAILSGIILPALAEEVSLPDLYKNLAEKNNYPAVRGLVTANADVKCNILDQVVGAFPEAADQPIGVRFNWSRPTQNDWPQSSFAVNGIPDGLTDLVDRAGKIFQGRERFVIEDPVYWIIGLTQASAVEQNGTITVTGQGEEITHLTVEIEGATYKVHKILMEMGGSQTAIEMTREDLGGRWGPKSLVLTDPTKTLVIDYEYTQVESFWLPAKMSVEFKGTEEPPYVYEFSNWKIQAQAVRTESAS